MSSHLRIVGLVLSVLLPVLQGGSFAPCFAGEVAGVQEHKVDAYDAALDEYAAICDKCLTLKDRIRKGEDVPAGEFENLLGQLSKLRGTLSAASQSMSVAQRSRYQRIRHRYINGLRSREAVSLARVGGSFSTTAESSCPSVSLDVHGLVAKPVSEEASPMRPKIGLSFLIGLAPMQSYGGMASVSCGEFGGYVSARSSFGGGKDEAYECLADGTTDDGYIWTSGKSSQSRLSLTGGVIWNATTWAHPFAGLGYGKRDLWWEDTEGRWAHVTDKTCSGLQVEIGIMLTYKVWSLSVGCTALPSDSYADLSVGVGVFF